VTAPLWWAGVLRDDAAFGPLAEEWEDLYRRCAAATPFQSFGWLESWWREYGQPGRLRLALARRDGVLVAAAPLMLRGRGPFRVLVPIGREQSDYHDVLAADSCRAEALRALSGAVLAEPGWHVLDLPEVRAGATAGHLSAGWAGRRWQAPGSACLEIGAGSVEEFVDRLPRSTNRRLRSKLRRIDRVQVQVDEVDPGRVARAVGDLLALHERQWHGRGINPEHLRPRYRRHLATAADRMVPRGQANVVQYRVDGRLVASDLDVIGPGFVGTYLAGFEPALRQRVDVGLMMLSQALRLSERLGLPRLHLLRGTEPYKMRWHPTTARNRRLLLARAGRHPAAPAYAAMVRCRAALADRLRDRAPWLRRARTRVRLAAGTLRGRPQGGRRPARRQAARWAP
jgi:CelD/BcsL family acetyltransferase involved in cellulose biosynthesis